MKKIILKKTAVANLSKDGMNALRGGSNYDGCGPVGSGNCGSEPGKTITCASFCYETKNGAYSCACLTAPDSCICGADSVVKC